MSDEIDYVAAAHELGSLCEDSAEKWAAAFCQHQAKSGFPSDEANMIGWFANAIEIAHDYRVGNRAAAVAAPKVKAKNAAKAKRLGALIHKIGLDVAALRALAEKEIDE